MKLTAAGISPELRQRLEQELFSLRSKNKVVERTLLIKHLLDGFEANVRPEYLEAGASIEQLGIDFPELVVDE